MSFNHTILYMPVDIPKFHMKQELIADFHKEFTPHTAQACESQRLLKTTKKRIKFMLKGWLLKPEKPTEILLK